MPLLNAPSLKQKRVVKEYLATGSKTEAVRRVYSKNNATSMVHRVFNAPGTREVLRKALEMEGLTDEHIAGDLSSLARKTKVTKRINDPRLHFDVLKEINKLKGNYPAEKKQVEQRTANLNITTDANGNSNLAEKLQELTKQMQNFQKIVKEAEQRKNEM